MHESMYTDKYLDFNTKSEKKYTTSTFLTHELQGKAKKYSGGYFTSLTRSLEAREKLGTAKRVPSVSGRTAWVHAEKSISTS